MTKASESQICELQANDLVSIIVPVWNVSPYLPYCLKSLLNQTYSNVEIILADDGSDDGSEIICDQAAQQDQRVKVIHKDHEGLSAARNSGMRIARGKWIVFVDSDDYVDTKYVEVLLAAARQSSADCALCRFRVTDEYHASVELRNCRNRTIAVPHVEVLTSTEAVQELLSERKASTAAWAKLAKAESWKQHPFPEGRSFEDLPVSWKVLADSSLVAIAEPPLYFYVKRNSSITKSPSIESLQDYLVSIEQVYKEIPQRYGDVHMRRCLDFRVCLECCRVIEMCHSVHESVSLTQLNRIETSAKACILKHMFSAFCNVKAPLLQRLRIILSVIMPSMLLNLNKVLFVLRLRK